MTSTTPSAADQNVSKRQVGLAYEQSQEPAELEGASLHWTFMIMTLEWVLALLFLSLIAVGMGDCFRMTLRLQLGLL